MVGLKLIHVSKRGYMTENDKLKVIGSDNLNTIPHADMLPPVRVHTV